MWAIAALKVPGKYKFPVFWENIDMEGLNEESSVYCEDLNVVKRKYPDLLPDDIDGWDTGQVILVENENYHVFLQRFINSGNIDSIWKCAIPGMLLDRISAKCFEAAEVDVAEKEYVSNLNEVNSLSGQTINSAYFLENSTGSGDFYLRTKGGRSIIIRILLHARIFDVSKNTKRLCAICIDSSSEREFEGDAACSRF